MGREVAIEEAEVRGSIAQVEHDVFAMFFLHKVEVPTRAPYIPLFIFVVVISFVNFFASLAASVIHLKLYKLIYLIFPVHPLVNIVAISCFSYAAACLYKEMLTDRDHNIFSFTYICALSTIYLPFAILIGCSFPVLYYLCFIPAAIASEFTCRKSIIGNHEFQDNGQKMVFIGISLLIHFGFYIILAPLFIIMST